MSDAFVVAVEASRLAQELRGIGREVWALLPRLLRQRPSLRLVLLIRRSGDAEPIRRRLAELDAPLDRVTFESLGRIDRVRADVFWYPWNVSLPAPRRGVVVATIQDVAPLVLPDPRRRKWLKNYRWRRRYGYTARRADMIIAISRFTSDEVHRVLHVPYERMRVTPLAADDLRIPPAERDAEALQRLGVRPPFATWGNILADGRSFIFDAPWLFVIPGSAILIVVLAFNLVGEGLRDAMNPKLRRRAG